METQPEDVEIPEDLDLDDDEYEPDLDNSLVEGDEP